MVWMSEHQDADETGDFEPPTYQMVSLDELKHETMSGRHVAAGSKQEDAEGTKNNGHRSDLDPGYVGQPQNHKAAQGPEVEALEPLQ